MWECIQRTSNLGNPVNAVFHFLLSGFGSIICEKESRYYMRHVKVFLFQSYHLSHFFREFPELEILLKHISQHSFYFEHLLTWKSKRNSYWGKPTLFSIGFLEVATIQNARFAAQQAYTCVVLWKTLTVCTYLQDLSTTLKSEKMESEKKKKMKFICEISRPTAIIPTWKKFHMLNMMLKWS